MLFQVTVKMRGTWEGQKPALIVCFLMLRESFAFKHKPKELPKAWSLFGENTELFNSLYCPFSRTVCNGRSWEPSDYLESISWEFKPFCLCVKTWALHTGKTTFVFLSRKKNAGASFFPHLSNAKELPELSEHCYVLACRSCLCLPC